MIKYVELLDIDKIKEVYKMIRGNTKNKNKLYKFEFFYLCNIVSIYSILKAKKYSHNNYNIFLIQEPKYRIIMSEIMSDKIVNHLISKYVLSPLIEPKLIEQNVATRKNKGTKEGLKYVKMYINKLKFNNEKIYVLKCDIKKYFYNIDYEIMLDKIKNIGIDNDIFKIIENIVNSTYEEYVNNNIIKIKNNEIKRINNLNISNKANRVEELLNIPTYAKGKGLPIGNMTSQILAIYYLNDLDHFIKEKLHCKYYVRYMDDFVIFDTDKERLKELKNILSEKLKDVKLELNDKTNIYDLSKGFNFLGYKFILVGKKLIVKINNQTKRRIKKRIKKLEKRTDFNKSVIKASYRGYLSFANSGNLIYKLHL